MRNKKCKSLVHPRNGIRSYCRASNFNCLFHKCFTPGGGTLYIPFERCNTLFLSPLPEHWSGEGGVDADGWLVEAALAPQAHRVLPSRGVRRRPLKKNKNNSELTNSEEIQNTRFWWSLHFQLLQLSGVRQGTKAAATTNTSEANFWRILRIPAR